MRPYPPARSQAGVFVSTSRHLAEDVAKIARRGLNPEEAQIWAKTEKNQRQDTLSAQTARKETTP